MHDCFKHVWTSLFSTQSLKLMAWQIHPWWMIVVNIDAEFVLCPFRPPSLSLETETKIRMCVVFCRRMEWRSPLECWQLGFGRLSLLPQCAVCPHQLKMPSINSNSKWRSHFISNSVFTVCMYMLRLPVKDRWIGHITEGVHDSIKTLIRSPASPPSLSESSLALFAAVSYYAKVY